MLALQTMADEMEREKARQRMVDTMARKARAGHVTGGKCFGYENVEIRGINGERSHVEQRVKEGEAAVIRRIFELAASGYGQVQIAKMLNADGARPPRSQQGRPSAWGLRRCMRLYSVRATVASSCGTRRRSAIVGDSIA